MKTKEELNTLKEEFENLNRRLAELTEGELAQVFGGLNTDFEQTFKKKEPDTIYNYHLYTMETKEDGKNKFIG